MDIILFLLTLIFLGSSFYLVYAFINKKTKKVAAITAIASFVLAVIIAPTTEENKTKESKTVEKQDVVKEQQEPKTAKIDSKKLAKEIEVAAFPAKVSIVKKNIIVEFQGNFRTNPRFDYYFPNIGRVFDKICKYNLDDFLYIIFDMKPYYNGNEKHLMKIRFIASSACSTWKDLRENQKRNLGSAVYALFNTYLYPSDAEIYDKESFINVCYERPEIGVFCRKNLKAIQ
ncbi:hypothetical protein [Desulfurobacterium indicum]|uniref:Uncharacterized protein n=1 Tax=Desulfurobacterium indicum TaxID=1914305 RepID=A0A1R1MK85_9BACT|nr:hypothetical protein [Desulfurobacterium indicum]OMH40221.1 hypothetical protein BLW93_06325 [Desulfurobacterium indicum]